MSRKLVDDATGKVINSGRYYSVSEAGGNGIQSDFVNLEDALNFMRAHLIGTAKPYVSVTTIYFDEASYYAERKSGEPAADSY